MNHLRIYNLAWVFNSSNGSRNSVPEPQYNFVYIDKENEAKTMVQIK